MPKTAKAFGCHKASDALSTCVEAIGGFPYMMQLVGYRAWEATGERAAITTEDARTGIRRARVDLTDGVLTTTYRELPAGDRRFLMAMLDDDGPSRSVDIARRLGKSSGHVSTYRRRLLKRGLIEELPDSTVRICIPFFEDYLRSIRQ